MPKADEPLPSFTLKAAVLEFDGRTDDGQIVRAVTLPFFMFLRMFQKRPESVFEVGPWQWEEIIAGAYTAEGYEVVLTPRSGDGGRDVIATRQGFGSIRIFDQVKAYSPGHLVPANDVRAMLGVITGFQNVSKGVITTTSDFAPGVRSDPAIQPHLPFRLELVGHDELLARLAKLARK